MDAHAPRPPDVAPSTEATSSSDIAKRLFALQNGVMPGGDGSAASGEQLFARLLAGLSRWFGPYGSAALVTRALVRAQVEHPALASVVVSSTESPSLTGFTESVQAHGSAACASGVVATLTSLAELLGRLIGDDLAASLLEQSAQTLEPSGSVVTAQSANHARPDASAPDDVPQPVKGHE
jgi:hypothetical protein